jgi:hypothetical protein
VFGVEVAGRLIGYQNLGLADNGPGDRHPLALTAGQFQRVVIFFTLQADYIKDFWHSMFDFGS